MSSEIDFPENLVEIGDHAFENTQIHGSLIFPDYFEKIGDYAFSQCPISSIYFSNFIQYIGVAAFYGCTSLTGAFPSKTSGCDIGVMVFYGCSFTLMDISAKSIGAQAFAHINHSGDVIINCDEIGQGAFISCPSITYLDIALSNYSKETIIPNSFAAMCTSLLEVNIYGNVIKLDRYAFELCTNLRVVNFPITVQIIGKGCFFGCFSLMNNLILSNYTNLTEIYDEAFYGCPSIIGEVSFPNSLKIIGKRSFASLKITGSLNIPDSVESIGEQAFFHCDSLTGSLYIGDGCLSIGESAFSMCCNLSGSIYIGRSLEIIRSYSFYGCKSLIGSLSFNSQIREIGDFSFMGCTSLTGHLLVVFPLIHRLERLAIFHLWAAQV